jgi:hypothetical protein
MNLCVLTIEFEENANAEAPGVHPSPLTLQTFQDFLENEASFAFN